MSVRKMSTFFALVLAAAVVLAANVSVALATDPACVQACLERWQAERDACERAKEAVYANIAAEEQSCLAGCPPSNYLCQGKCMRDAEVKRRAYTGKYQRCIAQANTLGWNCYRDCTVSRAKP